MICKSCSLFVSRCSFCRQVYLQPVFCGAFNQDIKDRWFNSKRRVTAAIAAIEASVAQTITTKLAHSLSGAVARTYAFTIKRKITLLRFISPEFPTLSVALATSENYVISFGLDMTMAVLFISLCIGGKALLFVMIKSK